jgi:hypothetical protein
MRKLMISAAGAAVVPFIAFGANIPVAQAGPLCPPSMAINPTNYQRCLQAEQNQNSCGDVKGCTSGGIPGLINQGCALAGIC